MFALYCKRAVEAASPFGIHAKPKKNEEKNIEGKAPDRIISWGSTPWCEIIPLFQWYYVTSFVPPCHRGGLRMAFIVPGQKYICSAGCYFKEFSLFCLFSPEAPGLCIICGSISYFLVLQQKNPKKISVLTRSKWRLHLSFMFEYVEKNGVDRRRHSLAN